MAAITQVIYTCDGPCGMQVSPDEVLTITIRPKDERATTVELCRVCGADVMSIYNRSVLLAQGSKPARPVRPVFNPEAEVRPPDLTAVPSAATPAVVFGGGDAPA